jgi:hypothetical protein
MLSKREYFFGDVLGGVGLKLFAIEDTSFLNGIA